MLFKRDTLVSALIRSGSSNRTQAIHTELLNVIYRLLEQEDINKEYIDEFQYYENLSKETVEFYHGM